MSGFLKSKWIYIIAALITIIGLITGWYLFIFLVFPLGFFQFNRRNDK